MTVTTRKSVAGNKLEASFVSSNRYNFDWCGPKSLGWRQYDTWQDAWYYGIWFNPSTLQTVSYTEGDIHLITCETWKDFLREMKKMDEFHGAVPAMAVSGDGLGIDGRVQGNVTAYYDEEARLTPGEEQPEQRKPYTIMQIFGVFACGNKLPVQN